MVALLIALLIQKPVATDGMYSVWAAPGLHLMMDDNGTPDYYGDDWVADWEDNRSVTVKVWDK